VPCGKHQSSLGILALEQFPTERLNARGPGIF
jgi:hypothetical protein